MFKNNLLLIRLTLKNIIYFTKSLISLDILNSYENKGYLNRYSKIKFTAKTALKVPFNLGRSARGIAFNNKLFKEPFFKIVYQISLNKSIDQIKQELHTDLLLERNLNAADIVNFSNNKKLKNYPAWAYVLPWENLKIEDKFKHYEELQIQTRKNKHIQYKINSEVLEKDYIYSMEIAESHVLQTQKLYKSILEKGYNPKLEIPSIFILVNKNKWRWFMAQGNHRAFICFLLKYKFLYCKIDSIIDKNNSNKWPNVINGTYSIKEAEGIFDYIFEGKTSIASCI